MIQPARSVEVYLPWNDPWIALPALPQYRDKDGTLYKITDTNIMSLEGISGSGNRLYLVGTEDMDWNTGKGTINRMVWQLIISDNVNQTYSWDNSVLSPDMAMGRLKFKKVIYLLPT